MTETRQIGFQPCKTAIELPKDAIADICNRWKIEEFYLFGSILRSDFHDDSDVDIMVTFSPEAHWGWEIVDIKDELEALFDRKVDFMTKAAIEESHNWIRRKEILGSAELVYVS
ncbi:MAG: nucleotidyltransferase family protein [Phormidesmis sp.]